MRVRRDRFGDPLDDLAEHTLTGCIVAPTGTRGTPLSAEEISTSGERIQDYADVYLPSVDVDVIPTDRIRRASDPAPADGAPMKLRAPWQVIGGKSEWRSPFTGWRPGAVIRIARVTG